MTTTKEKELSTRTWDYENGRLVLTSKIGEKHYILQGDDPFRAFLDRENPKVEWEDNTVSVNGRVVGICDPSVNHLSVYGKTNRGIFHFSSCEKSEAAYDKAEEFILDLLRRYGGTKSGRY